VGPTVLWLNFVQMGTADNHQQPVQIEWHCVLYPSDWSHLGIHARLLETTKPLSPLTTPSYLQIITSLQNKFATLLTW